jgi:hypothetical protein
MRQVIELMHRTPALPPSGAAAPPQLEGKIEFRDVSAFGGVSSAVSSA